LILYPATVIDEHCLSSGLSSSSDERLEQSSASGDSAVALLEYFVSPTFISPCTEHKSILFTRIGIVA
jgi:hypothetical protein